MGAVRALVAGLGDRVGKVEKRLGVLEGVWEGWGMELQSMGMM